MNIKLVHFDTLTSTNTEALDQARSGAPEGLCIIAREQTAGRGRRDRTWLSKKDAGLYFSIVLRPNLPPKYLPLITLMAGVAAYDTLSDLGIEPDLKWVNDIHVHGKKIGGILAEMTETDLGLAIIVGIGINLKDTVFATEIANTATSVESETGRIIAVDVLTSALTKYIDQYYAVLAGQNGPALIVEEWQKRSTYFAGKSVRVRLENNTITGITDGLEETGALRVRHADGTVTIVQAGDVEQLRPDAMTA